MLLLQAMDSAVVMSFSSDLLCLAGAEITYSVWAQNRLFDGPVSSITHRAMEPPSQVLELASKEVDGGIVVTWYMPMDTVYGDTSARVEYTVEVSTCKNVHQSDLEGYYDTFGYPCEYHRYPHGVGSGIDQMEVHHLTGLVENRPIMYLIRVVATNAAGEGVPSTVQQAFLMGITTLSAKQIFRGNGVFVSIGWQARPFADEIVKSGRVSFAIRVTTHDGRVVEDTQANLANLAYIGPEIEMPVPVPVPETPFTTYTISVRMLSGAHGDQGPPIIIGRPPSLSPLSVVEAGNTWSLQWSRPTTVWPTAAWYEGEARVMSYLASVSCAGASTAIVLSYEESKQDFREFSSITFEAQWIPWNPLTCEACLQFGREGSRSLKLTAKDSRAVSSKNYAITCPVGSDVSFTVLAVNQFHFGPDSWTTRHIIALPSQVLELASEEVDEGIMLTLVHAHGHGLRRHDSTRGIRC